MKVVLADVPQFPELQADLDRLTDSYLDAGIEVTRYAHDEHTHDSVFLRDVFGWAPFKLIRPQSMGKESRRWESDAFFETFYPGDTGRVHYLWLKEGFFEGADILFPVKRHAIIGVGSRTSDRASELIVEWLEHKDPYCTNDVLYLPDWHEQHLLGLVNCVYGDNMYVDQRVWEECGDSPPACLDGAVVLPHEEYHDKHTNWTQYRDKIFINAGAVKTIEILRGRGLTVVPVDIPALIANGGGVACSTGILVP